MPSPAQFVAEVGEALEAARNPLKAGPMAKYMKNHFPFLGLPRPLLETTLRPMLVRVRGRVDAAWLEQSSRLLWGLDEREYQYAAALLLWAERKVLRAENLRLAEELIPQKSWWDSVDDLSSNLVSPLVRRFPELRLEMDRWSRHPNFWLRRSAIIHQLGYRAETDAERLFDYALHNAADQEFFIRKAIGWALREYAKVDAGLVYAFVDHHRGRFSALTVREALKHR
ncbi:MAG: DNA alkylation repair protein [Meiothermus sp.]|nr:DNA alkylation repair protein [Meiothermus sp.]